MKTYGKHDNIRACRVTALAFTLVFVFIPLLCVYFATPVAAVPRAAVTAENIGIDTQHIKSAYLYNIENDFIICSYNADDAVYPTSTAKIMTGILAIEALSGRLKEKVTVTAEMLEGVGGNNIKLVAGEEISIESLLYAMLAGGANDAAQVLAILVAGTVDEFVAKMNRRAADLGAENTHYTNPSGVHNSEMYTTARDTVTIALEAYKLPLFMTITSTSKYVIDETNKSEFRSFYNKNFMVSSSGALKYYYKNAAGMNSGATSQGGYCLVTTAQREGLTYLAVVMGADVDEEKDKIYSYTEAATLLDYAFESYGNIKLIDSGSVICEIPVELSGTADYVTLVTADSMYMYLPTDTDLETEIKFSRKTSFDSLTAPVAEGAVAGVLTVMYHDEIIGNIDLVTTVAIARSEFLYTLEQIEDFATGRFFITFIISTVLLTVLYIFGKAIYLHRKTKHRGRYI